MKKTIIALLAAVLVLSLGIGAFANGAYTMKHLPGTQDEVADMPQEGIGAAAEAYAVSETVPTREGYEFIGWILDCGPAVSYTVRYLELGTDAKLAEEDVIGGKLPGDMVSADAIDIDFYNKTGETTQTLTLGKDSAENVITFRYTKVPVAPYTVKYMGPDPETGEEVEIYDAKVVPGIVIGTEVSEKAADISGYILDDDAEKPLTVGENEEKNVIIFRYKFAPVGYTVRYLEEGTEKELVTPSKLVENQQVGTTVTEMAINIDEYNLIADDFQSKKLGMNAEENVITFYYAARSGGETDPEYFGPTCVDYITDEPYIVHHVALGRGELATDYGTALAGEPLTVYARYSIDQYTPLPPMEQTKETVPCNHVLEYQEFHAFDDSWCRFTVGDKANWQFDGLQQYCVVAKYDDEYTIWTKDQLSEEEQVAIYESFSKNVYGAFKPEYANCQFMYANGSTLNGVTINDDYILFDDPDGWSFAIGSYLPSYEKIYEKGGDTLEFTFLYGGSVRR